MGAALRRTVAGIWERRGIMAWVLWPLSMVYGLLVAVRRFLYRAGFRATARVPVPVIVVGNVVAGGGGKTPLVMAIVCHLQRQGHQVGVVSRGYGRGGVDCREVLPDSAAADVGDEPLLVRQSTGAVVFVAPQRIDAARALLRRYPEVDRIVCDDGLQHLALQRDLEVCVFGDGGIGNGFLLPAGPLREPWPRPVDLLVADYRSPVEGASAVRRSLASHARRADGTQVSLDILRTAALEPGANFCAVAGIARPQSFFAMLRDAGMPLSNTLALRDHASFDGPQWADGTMQTILCTEKDAVKLWQYRPDAWAVPLQIELDNGFWAHFDATLQARAGAKLSSAHGYKTS
jgi:tetraacyldisaccharide 4'-kinase